MDMRMSRRRALIGAAGLSSSLLLPACATARPWEDVRAPMTPERSLESYRRILCGDIGEEVLWWFIGDLYLHTPGESVVPVARSMTIGGYTAQTVTDREFTYGFREAGVIVDLNTGEPLTQNPFTGATVEPPTVDEPPEVIRWVVRDDGDIVKTQHGKDTVLDLRWTETSSSLLMIETTPGANAFSLAPNDSGADWSALDSTRTVYAKRDDLARPGFVPADMIYNVALKLTLPWMQPATPGDRFLIVRGIGQKSRKTEVVNADALELIRRFFPAFL